MVTFHKVVGSVPATPDPDAIYFVRVGQGFDVWVTDSEGVPVRQNSNAASSPTLVFTTLPSLMGSTALGGTLIVDLGVVEGTDAATLSGTVSRSGNAPVNVSDGQSITVQEGDLGNQIVLVSTATNADFPDGVQEIVEVSIPAIAPLQFAGNAWSVTTGLEPFQIVLNISALPFNGGSAILELQYNIGDGWVALTGTGTGPRVLTMSEEGIEYDFSLRAVNAVDAGEAATVKSANSGGTSANIAENWRLGINGTVVDSAGNTTLASQIAASSVNKTLPSWSSNRVITIPIEATGSKGGIAVWYAFDPAVHTLEQSFNGTDWTDLPVRKNPIGGSLPHRTSAIPAGPARTLRFSGDAVSGFGLFNIPESELPDLWLQAGASHTVSGARPLDMRAAVIAAFPNRDPIFLNYAESAQTSDTVTARILAGAAQVPEARLCLAETGGNNVSQKKPFNPSDNMNLAGSIQNMLDGLAAADVITYMESIAYRPYTETLNGERNDLGSLPFNTQIVYPQIEARIPFAFDPDLRIARIDNYNLMWVHRDKFDADNTHPSEIAGYPIQRAFWVNTAIRHAYTGQWPTPYAVQMVEAAEASPTYVNWYNAMVIVRDLPASVMKNALIARVDNPAVYESALLNGATLSVERAESIRTQIAKDAAQTFVNRVSDSVYSAEKLNLQNRLDAIVITTSRTVQVSFGTNNVAPPTRGTGSVSASSVGLKIADIADIDGLLTGWSIDVETGYGFTAGSGGHQPDPNNTGYPLDMLLGYGSYGAGSTPTFYVRNLNPAKRYRLVSVLSRAQGVGWQTVIVNGGSSPEVVNNNAPFAEVVTDNISPIDLGSGVMGIRVSMTTRSSNSAYAGFRLTESDPT